MACFCSASKALDVKRCPVRVLKAKRVEFFSQKMERKRKKAGKNCAEPTRKKCSLALLGLRWLSSGKLRRRGFDCRAKKKICSQPLKDRQKPGNQYPTGLRLQRVTRHQSGNASKYASEASKLKLTNFLKG